MEPDTVTTPKINKTTFKLGSGNLSSQVAKNTEKITLLRRIVTRQDTKISEGITPKIDSMQESMIQTNAILTDVASQLEKDFSSRLKEQKDLLERERKDSDKLKRDLKEERLEGKKSSKFARGLTGTIAKPFQSIFSKLFELATILGTGFLINNIAFNKDLQEGIKNVFDWTTKNWKLVAAIGGGLVLLNFLGAAKTLLSLGKIMLGFVFSKPFLLATAFIAPAFLKVIPDEIKLAISELEKMGGATKENREKLKEELTKELYSIKGIDLTGERTALNKMIKFLDTGIIEGPGVKGQFDFEQFNQGSSVIESITQFNQGGEVLGQGNKDTVPAMLTPGEFVFKKSAVDKIGLENLYRMNEGGALSNINIEQLAPIDLRKKKVVKKISGNPATYVEHINPINSSNPYMNEVPMLFGFNDLVYT